MPTRVQKLTVALRDARGHVGKVSAYLSYDDATTGSGDASAGHGEDFQTQVAALSNASLYNATGAGGTILAPNTYGANAEYPNAEDKARLIYLTAVNTLTTFNIPAPKLSIFEADGETVKPSAVTGLTGILTAAPVDDSQFTARSSAPITAFIGGYRVRRKFQRKLTIYDKSSNLDEPEE